MQAPFQSRSNRLLSQQELRAFDCCCQKSTLEGDALRFAGYLKLKQLQMGKRDRLVALRNMQNRFPIGEHVVHNGMKYAVEGVIPTVSAADCRDGTPSGDRMFTLRLRGTDGELHRVLVADLVQEVPSSED